MTFNFQNPKTFENASINLLTTISSFSSNDFEKIKEIFNQPEIYKIFGKNLNSKEIEVERIKSILNWYIKSVKENICELYLIRNSKNEFVGGIDLQFDQDNPTTITIGFWSDSKQKGFISGAIIKLKQILIQKNIQEINSYIEKENIKAKSVLQKNDFQEIGEIVGKSGKILVKFCFNSPPEI